MRALVPLLLISLSLSGQQPISRSKVELGELEELSTQACVYSASLPPQENEAWVNQCLNLNLDYDLFRCKIVAYRIQWFSGKWSGWFVPGVNDLYKKSGEPLRRFWACFNDHAFEIIYQTTGKPIDFTARPPKPR